MAKTYADVITEARQLLQDTETPQRYSDTILLAKLNRALQELGRLRPDAFYDRFDDETSTIIVPEVVLVDADPDTDPDELNVLEDGQVALTDNFEAEMQFYTPMVYFITASAEILDDEFTTDGRASMLMAQFKQSIIGL
ncbi:MAG: hypothetical protein ABW110_03740 [Steroidobacteraceae bacterium]